MQALYQLSYIPNFRIIAPFGGRMQIRGIMHLLTQNPPNAIFYNKTNKFRKSGRILLILWYNNAQDEKRMRRFSLRTKTLFPEGESAFFPLCFFCKIGVNAP